MVSLGFSSFLEVALPIFVVWRTVLWIMERRPMRRELLVWVLFVYLLAVALVAFFPMNIIFYDWHGRYNLVPFASISDMIQHTTRATAFRNIGGNVVMFIPLGFLLPLLFRQARTLWSLVWRVLVISVAIELLQLLTQVRATDVDDVILNLVGALVGYGIYRLVAHAVAHKLRGALFLERLGKSAHRGPLLSALIPVAASIVVFVGAIAMPAIIHNTMNEDAIKKDVSAGMADGGVVAIGDSGQFEFLLASNGPVAREVFRIGEYKRVLPGRFTKVAIGDIQSVSGSYYSYGATAWDTRVDKGPAAYVYGRNVAGALTLVVTRKSGKTVLRAEVGRYFVVVLPEGTDPFAGVNYTFLDPEGRDVTSKFKTDQ